ncbi:HlyD family secretion protein [Abyssalbus ytuae]|uniref:Efflux RND transporter periplasmic adaptor subunit n=1 Tax=Abyssalbus ytuae TaxID=2926907 RepID=A0A9E6ZPZ0_9FLAO|nr:efflux RND transporter periplasmic adaptor subunit [Abyssalbus ytuae]UOB16638.1 efflux RND transporter periplasmic adaptor subunit [Abyssalbus ytuae]
MKKTILLLPISLVLLSCSNKKGQYDASGTFEAIEVKIASQANGVIEQLNISEGQTLEIGQFLGYIDSTQLYLKKQQLEAQIKVLLNKKPNIIVQLSSLEEQLRQAKREQKRVQNLVSGNAAPQKLLDDANSQVEIIENKIRAQKSTLSINTTSLINETEPLQMQIRQLNDQLEKCKIINKVKGTVLIKYVEENEMVSPGSPLYNIANLDTLTLRAYITGNQLPEVKINQEVEVLVDNESNGYKTYKGTIGWISDKAEFTPKTIQTKDERANLVYAVKIEVPNDGFLKIGMYGEVNF